MLTHKLIYTEGTIPPKYYHLWSMLHSQTCKDRRRTSGENNNFDW